MLTSEHKNGEKQSAWVKDLSPVDMDQTVPYVDQTQREVPFIDFMIPLNPLVQVSTVYARHTALLSG